MASIDPVIFNSVIPLEPGPFTVQMWGGEWIPRFKGLPKHRGPVGESWEFSVRPERPAVAVLENGQRVKVDALIKKFPKEILGAASAPFLIKLIDANDDLSLQVHPSDDDLASTPKQEGKAEAWLILETGDSKGDGFIYLGFDPRKADGYPDQESFESAFFDAINQANGMGPSLDEKIRAKAEALIIPFLNKIHVKPGEVYEIKPGLIHATGRGVRLYEVQQNSDVTYRMWDWNRPDSGKKGKKIFRPLHLKEARQVLNFRPSAPEDLRLSPMLVKMNGEGKVREELLVIERQKKFAANRIRIEQKDAEMVVETRGQMQVLTVTEGSVQLRGKIPLVLQRGHSALVPASVSSFSIKAVSSPAVVIRSYLPI